MKKNHAFFVHPYIVKLVFFYSYGGGTIIYVNYSSLKMYFFFISREGDIHQCSPPPSRYAPVGEDIANFKVCIGLNS